MTWIKRFFFLLFMLLILASATGIFVWFKYADQLKVYALDAVRSTITTDLEFNEDVVFSLFQDFPLVSVEITDIRIEDSFGKDTLLNVKKAFVQFDLLKLIRNEIVIEGIRLTDGFLKLRRDASGEWNFRVWKVNSESDEPTSTNFSIEILTLQNVHLDYDDRSIDLNIQYLSEKSKIKGKFSDANTHLNFSLRGYMASLNTIGSDRVIELPLNLAGILNINSTEKVYTIEMGNAVLAGNEMILDAEWTKVEDGTNMMLRVHAENIEPEELLPHVWPDMPENVRNLQIRGSSDLTFSLTGPFTRTTGPQLDASISLRDGGLVFRNTEVSDLQFAAKLFMEDLKRSKAMQLTFDSFKMRTSSGSIVGKATLTDLSNPRLRLTTSGQSKLEELIEVAGIKEELTGSGNIAWNIDFEGPLGPEFQTSKEDLKEMRWSGTLELEKTELNFNASVPPIRELSAKIEMKLGRTTITNASGSIGHLEFDGNVDINELKEIFINPNSDVTVAGNIHVKALDITKLPEEWNSETNSSNSESVLRPITINMETNIDRIEYNQFSATDVSGKIDVKNERLHVSGLKFNALDGSISSDLSFEPEGKGYLLGLEAEMRNVNMSRALEEWDNFGQKTVTSKNLRGRATASLEAEIHLSSDYQIIKDQLRVESKVEIVGGELLNFEPLQALSKFIDVDELSHVRFDTLQNQLSIRNSKLFIPRMSISSNILNVDVFGEHAFDQEMDYHVNLLLNDLIRRKTKEKKSFEGHEIIDEKGKTRLFLWIRGKPGNIKVGFDKREVTKKLKDDFKKEGQTIKQLFRDEFSGEKEKPSEQKQVKFTLEDPQSSPQKTETATDKTAENKPKKKKGFFASDSEEEETEGKFEIEFDP